MIFWDHLLQAQHPNTVEVRQKWMNKELLSKPRHQKEACRWWRQGQVKCEGERAIVGAVRDQVRKAKAVTEFNLDRDIRAARKFP